MGNGENAGKVSGDRINGCYQAIAPLLILGAEALVNNQKLQGPARSLGQQPSQG